MNTMERKGFGALLPQYNVEGFDPNDILVLVEKETDGSREEFLYMEYQASAKWFFTVFPNGCMNHTVNAMNDRMATVTASIFRDVNDARAAVTATVTRFYSDDAYGRAYAQNAVAGAYRKALEILGFGMPADAHKTEHTRIRQVNEDAPEEDVKEGGKMILPRPATPAADNTQKDEKDSGAGDRVKSVKSEQMTGRKQLEGDKNASNPAQTTPVPAPVSNAKDQTENPVPAPKPTAPQAPAPKAPKSCGVMSFQEASEVRLPYGSMAGKTIAECDAEKGGNFIRYHCDRVDERKAPELKQALQIYCEYRGY